MFGAYCMVTVYHNKAKIFVQHLIGGNDFPMVSGLRNYICEEVFRGNMKHIKSTITEILADEIRCHVGCNKEYISFQRDIDHDAYLIHAFGCYDKKEKNYTLHMGYTNEPDADVSDAIGIANTNILMAGCPHLINRISPCGIELVNGDGGYVRTTYLKTSRRADDDAVYVDDDVLVRKIETAG